MSPGSEPPADSAAPPKIAIKGFSLSSKAKPNNNVRPKPSSTLGKRPRASLHHDSEDEDEREDRNGAHEEVTGFDISEGGALKKEYKKEEVKIIPRQANRDWRAEIKRRGKNLLPQEVQAEMRARAEGRADVDASDIVNAAGSEPQWGLTVTKRERVEDGEVTEEKVEVKVEGREVVEEVKGKTDDEKALEALLGTNKEKKGPDLVIPAQRDVPEDRYDPANEADAYRKAIEAAPEVSTLEDYEAMPVEDFGAALLRGMGWDGKERKGAKEVKRRQNLLGLGAKELKDAEELGAWVQKSDTKRLKSGGDRHYERRPKPNEYKRDRDRDRDDRGSYKRDRERERERDRDDYRRDGRRDDYRRDRDYRR
jgi:hypothetical protein